MYINNFPTQYCINSVLVGGKGYGTISQPGKINNIYVTNIIGVGGRNSLILVEAPIANCYFMNAFYKGAKNEILAYNIDKTETTNIISQNLVKIY